ncbi:MAG: FHA domain-containing protein [Verrucomicrobia bacterium]|nr:FHA domain-containing protein [Verrucomicrobiota bacterium]
MSDDRHETRGSAFFFTGGTLRADAESYVERPADRKLLQALSHSEFCYVLTSRQMGKSSLMVRTARRLRERGVRVVVLDLTALGLNVSPEQWYDGFIARLGNQLDLESELEEFWLANRQAGPLQRLLDSLGKIVLPTIEKAAPGQEADQRLVIFIDEIDVVRSLPFSSDEFFSGIRECYNRRALEPRWSKLTFCLLGAATPADLIRDQKITPFNIGRRIELTDFGDLDTVGLQGGLRSAFEPVFAGSGGAKVLPTDTRRMVSRVLHWTGGHPYLTQRLCRALAEIDPSMHSELSEEQLVDRFCDELFLSTQARERDDNLLYVRDRVLRTNKDLAGVLNLYQKALQDEFVAPEENHPLLDELRLAGLLRLRSDGTAMEIRNRIYRSVFDQGWVRLHRPDALLVRENGERIALRSLCNIGRAPSNELVLQSERVSRRHAQIQMQPGGEFWLVDLGSSNGTLLNGRPVTSPIPLRDQDLIEIGQIRLVFQQERMPRGAANRATSHDATVTDTVIASRSSVAKHGLRSPPPRGPSAS